MTEDGRLQKTILALLALTPLLQLQKEVNKVGTLEDGWCDGRVRLSRVTSEEGGEGKTKKQKVVLVFLMKQNSPADGLTHGVGLGAAQEVSRLTRGDF